MASSTSGYRHVAVHAQTVSLAHPLLLHVGRRWHVVRRDIVAFDACLQQLIVGANIALASKEPFPATFEDIVCRTKCTQLPLSVEGDSQEDSTCAACNHEFRLVWIL